MVTVYKLAGHGLSQQDSATIEATLELASGLELSQWQRSDLTDAQALILNIDDEDGALWWQYLNARSEIELPVILISNLMTLPEGSVQILHSPISYPLLLSALKQTERRLIALAQEAPLSCFGNLDCAKKCTETTFDPVVAEIDDELIMDLATLTEASKPTGQDSVDDRSLEANDQSTDSFRVKTPDSALSLVADDAAITQEIDCTPAESLFEPPDESEPILSLQPPTLRKVAPTRTEKGVDRSCAQDVPLLQPALNDQDIAKKSIQLPGNVVAFNSSVITPQKKTVRTIPTVNETKQEASESSFCPETQQPHIEDNPAKASPDQFLMSAMMRPARMYYPATRLLGLIRRVMLEEKSKEIYTAGFPPIQIFPISKAFIFSGRLDESEELFKKPLFEFDVREIKNSSPPALKRNAAPKPISILLYTAALYGSEGKYCQHAPPHGKIKLSKKPDFDQLPHTRDHLTLAEHLLKNSADILSIAKETGCELNEIVNFHNACCELHLVEHTEFSNPDKTEASCLYYQQDHSAIEKKMTFFGRIKKSFTRKKTEDEK